MANRLGESFAEPLFMDTRSCAQGLERTTHVIGGRRAGFRGCEQDDVTALDGQIARSGGGAQNTLGPVAHNCAAQPFGSNEGDPTGIAFVA